MARPDPNADHPTASRHGGIPATGHSAELGTIVATDATRMSYTVRTMRGRPLTGVPRIRYSPSDLTVLPVGTSVVVRFDLGLPVIDGVLDLPADPATDAGIPATGVPSLSTATNDSQTGAYRAPGEPTDLLPGDNIMGNKTGARVGVLGGGVALMSASQMSQIRAHVLHDLVEIISRNFRHITDMGITSITNRDGRINMSFRGASDQTNEAGADEENWTIRMDLGSEGDLFNFELTTPQGQTLFKLHVDSNGRCEIFGLDGVVVQSGNRNGEPHIAEQGGDSRDIVHGDRTLETDGDFEETIRGSQTSTVDGSVSTMCGNDLSSAAVRDVGISAGRNITLTAAGDKLGNPALNISAPGGDVTTTIGLPAFPTPGYALSTYKGDITFRSSLGGNFKVESPLGNLQAQVKKAVIQTTTPDSVILGGPALVAHLARFEQLEILLKALLRAFDSHTHPHPTAPTSAPTIPISSIITPLITPIKSLRVGVGG